MERLPGLQTPPSRNGILFNRTLLFSFFFIFLISWLVLTYLDLVLKETNKQWITHLKKRSQETMREKVYQMMMISFLYVISGVAILPFFEVPFTATSGKDRSWGIWYNLISVFNRLFRLDGYPGLQCQELSQWCIFFVSKGKLF